MRWLAIASVVFVILWIVGQAVFGLSFPEVQP